MTKKKEMKKEKEAYGSKKKELNCKRTWITEKDVWAQNKRSMKNEAE